MRKKKLASSNEGGPQKNYRKLLFVAHKVSNFLNLKDNFMGQDLLMLPYWHSLWEKFTMVLRLK